MTDDSGPAFPVKLSPSTDASEGMTKRELFAALAMAGILADPNSKGPNVEKEAPEVAIMAADELIKQLKK